MTGDCYITTSSLIMRISSFEHILLMNLTALRGFKYYIETMPLPNFDYVKVSMLWLVLFRYS